MPINRQTKFEIYVMQAGRWSIHAHFDAGFRDEAIGEARRVERQPGVGASCVMQTHYNPVVNEAVDKVIYYSASLDRRPTVSSLSRTTGRQTRGIVLPSRGKPKPPSGSAAANAATDYMRRAKEFQKKQQRESQQDFGDGRINSPTDISDFRDSHEKESVSDYRKLAIAFIGSGMMALAISASVYLVLHLGGLNFERTFILSSLAGSFAIVFLVMFVPMARRIAAESRQSPPNPDDKPNPDELHPPRSLAGFVEVENNEISWPVNKRDIAMASRQSETGLANPVVKHETGVPEPVAEGKLTVFPEEEDDTPDFSALKTEETFANPPGEENPSGEEIFGQTALQEDNARPPGESAVGKLTHVLNSLVQEAMGDYQADFHQDAFLRFGAALFVAGAAEYIARETGVVKKDYIPILIRQASLFGMEKAHARGFCVNIDEYLLDQRYLDMYNAGCNAGRAKLKSSTASSGFLDWLEYWKKPVARNVAENKQAQDGEIDGKRFVAVMFTDIANSTEKQQTRGDDWMMQMVRAHDGVVREMLAEYGGQEVKHLGDGIMAWFPAVAQAVAASIAMQKRFRLVCENNTDLDFQVRIGISAGVPIHESGDIFGTPVNLAARILNLAGPGAIAVSGHVRKICTDEDFRFIEQGEVKMKGFNEPQMIFFVDLE